MPHNPIYIASSLQNYQRVLDLRDKLAKHEIYLTCDWAQQHKNYLATHEKENYVKMAMDEYYAIHNCAVLLFVYPGGRGAHFELGCAYALHKPIVLLCDKITSSNDLIPFYTLSGIEQHYDEQLAIERIKELAMD